MSGAMITTRALTKRYGAVEAVRSVDLEVREGDRYGLLGPNGSGKTTLVRMLLGLVYATSGEIEVMGMRIPRHVREVLPQIGALIEEPAAYPHMSGRASRRRRIDEALELVGLAGVGRRPVKAYSLGMRQRLGLAAALIRHPRLLGAAIGRTPPWCVRRGSASNPRAVLLPPGIGRTPPWCVRRGAASNPRAFGMRRAVATARSG